MADNWASPDKNAAVIVRGKSKPKTGSKTGQQPRVTIASNIKVKGNAYVGATSTYFDNREGEYANAPRLTMPARVKDEDSDEDDERDVTFRDSEVDGDLYQKLKNVVVDNRKVGTAGDEQADPGEKTPAKASGNETSQPSSAELKKYMYQICEDISDADWLKFARTQLDLEDYEIDRIEVDYKHSVDERKYQMLRLWTRKNAASNNGEQIEKLNELRDRFRGKR